MGIKTKSWIVTYTCAAKNSSISETGRRGQASDWFACLACPYSLNVLEVAESGATRDEMQSRVGVMISHPGPEVERSLSVVPIF